MKSILSLFPRIRRGVLVTALALTLLAGTAYRPDTYFEVAKNIDIFAKVMREVMTNYVDEVEPNQFTRFGLDAMLKTLDPYTDFISASDIDDYRFVTTGQYGGIGALIGVRDNRVIVSEIYVGTPADKAGLRAGDQILQIDNENLQSKSYTPEQVSGMLKGQPKTAVKLRIQRINVAEPITLSLSREDIKLPNIEYAGLLPGEQGPVAYVVLAQFRPNAGPEVRKALELLRTKAGVPLKGIILDLRNNPGGLLNEAINVSNLFVAKGERIVETKGRMENMSAVHTAPNSPFDIETPLVVLVNQRAASASEIVAGVVQDLDRGVIVGRRSYGKGLVQTTLPLSYQAQIKITTARYYTPSGRCIQAIDYKHNDADGGVVTRADSTKQAFTTRRGRKVQDGGGIEPEVKVADREFHKITVDLATQNHIFDFATEYRSTHDKLAAPGDFTVDAALFDQFVEFVRARKFSYRSPAEQELAGVEDQLKKENYAEKVAPMLASLKEALKAQAAADMQNYREEVSLLLKRELVGRYYYQTGEHETTLKDDADIREAIKVLSEPARYTALLRPDGK
jgi:carboxyl-terminal processing protease